MVSRVEVISVWASTQMFWISPRLWLKSLANLPCYELGRKDVGEIKRKITTIEENPQKVQVLEIPDVDFMINMLKRLNDKLQNFSEELETFKKPELLKTFRTFKKPEEKSRTENTICEIKKQIDFNSKLELKEGISELMSQKKLSRLKHQERKG